MFSRKAAKQSAYVRYTEVDASTKANRSQNWTPFAIRLPFLVCFAGILLLCVAMLEVLVRQTDPWTKPNDSDQLSKRHIHVADHSDNLSTIPTPQIIVHDADSTERKGRLSSLYTRYEFKRLYSSTAPPSIVSRTSAYLDLGVTTTPAAAAPRTTTPITTAAPTFTAKGSEYLNLNTPTTQAKAAPTTAAVEPTTPVTTPVVVYSTMKSSAYIDLNTPTTPAKLAPTTATAAVDTKTGVSNPSAYINLGSSTTPVAANTPIATPVVVTTTTKEVQTFTQTGGYLNLDSTTTPAAANTPIATPVVMTTTTKEVQTFTQTGGYLNLDSTTTPAAKATTVPTKTSGYLDLNTPTTPAAKASTTTPAGETISETLVTQTSAYLNLDSPTTPAAKDALSTTPAAIVDTNTVPISTKSGYLDLGSHTTAVVQASTTAAVNKQDTNTEPISTKSGYLDLGSSTTSSLDKSMSTTRQSDADTKTGTASDYLNLASPTTTRGGANPTTTPISVAPSLTKSSGYLDLNNPTTSGSVDMKIGSTSTVTSVPTLSATGYLSLGSASTKQSTQSDMRSTGLNSDYYLNLGQPTTSRKSGGTGSITTSEPTTRGSTTKQYLMSFKSTSRDVDDDDDDDDPDTATDYNGTKETSPATTPSNNLASTTTTISSSSATATSTGFINPIARVMTPDMKVRGTFQKWWYFVAMYVPSLLAVLLRETWFIIASGLKMMEPFYQLNKPDGASARDSVMADYLSSMISPYSLGSAFRGNITMIIILVGNLIMYALAPLAAESMTIVALNISVNEFGDTIRNTPGWMLRLVLIRTLQATLCIVVMLIALLLFVGRKRRSGLSANPSKITTMGILLNHPGLIQSLDSIDSRASTAQIGQTIAHENYMITYHVDKYGNNVCGLVKVGDIVPQRVHQLPQDDHTNPTPAGISAAFGREGRYRGQRPIEERVLEGTFTVVAICLLGTLIAYWLDGTDSAFNTFFNSGTFGPKFILSIGASICVATFGSFEREVRLLLPYRRLAQRHAPPDASILRSVNGTAVSSLIRSVKHGTWFHFFIALATILGNILIIAIAGVPFNDNVTWIGLIVCLSLSVSITAIMLAATFTLFKWRHSNKKMDIPYQPNENLLRVWMSMSNNGNQLRTTLNDSEGTSDWAIRKRLHQEQGMYWAGWIRDECGRVTWCVDKESDRKDGSLAD